MEIAYRITFAAVVIIVAFTTGCVSSSSQKATPPAALRPNGTDAELAERILTIVPVGTPIETAKQSLINTGLRCSTELDTTTGEPYLSCSYSDERDIWITWVWSIRVECADRVVTGVTCKQAGIGL